MQLIRMQALWTIPLIYFGFGFALYLAQNYLLYLPDDSAFGDCVQAGDETIALTEDAVRGYYTPSPSGAEERLVVMYHGNAGNACHRNQLVNTLQTHDHAVLIVEYPGFADTSTRPNTRAILENVAAVADWVDAAPYRSITLLGESIGGGFASHHATLSEKDTELILLTPFARLSDRAQEAVLIYPVRWLLQEDLYTADWATAAERVTAIAAEHDQIMPRHHSDRLVEQVTESGTPTDYHIIPDTDHNTLYTSSAFREQLAAALATN